MPIQLTAPFKVGDFDDENYTTVKILHFSWDNVNKMMQIACVLGRMAAGKFAAGKKEPLVVVIKDIPAQGVEGDPGYVPADPQYTDLVTGTHANANELVYAAVQRFLYQWLLDRGYFTGTIV